MDAEGGWPSAFAYRLRRPQELARGRRPAGERRHAALDHELAQIAEREPWADPVAWLCSFRGIAIHTALGLLAEIGDFRRFASPREQMSYLGLTPSEYSSGDQQHRGHITKTGADPPEEPRLALCDPDSRP